MSMMRVGWGSLRAIPKFKLNKELGKRRGLSTRPHEEGLISSLKAKSRSESNVLVPFLAQQLDRTLSHLELGVPTKGEVIKEGILLPYTHVLYFPEGGDEPHLSEDGFDSTFAPPGYPYRVISSGKLQFSTQNWLQIGQSVYLKTTCGQVISGFSERRGPSLGVELENRYTNEMGWSLTEYRTITYFTTPTPKPVPRPSSKFNSRTSLTKEVWSKVINPTPILLFRYSALSFNAHRIHYDPQYTQNVEHHPDCLVHGPLLCTLVLRYLCHTLNTISRPWSQNLLDLEYRLIRPLYVNRPFTILILMEEDQQGVTLQILDEEGQLTFRGHANLAAI